MDRFRHPSTPVLVLVAILTVNGAYLAAYAAPTVFYVANVLLHILAGLALLVVSGRWLFERRAAVLPKLLLTLSGLTGVGLMVFGNPSARWLPRVAHIAFGFAFAAVLFWLVSKRRSGNPSRRFVAAAAVVLSLLVAAAHVVPLPEESVTNRALSPSDLAGDAMGGAAGPFFPSSAETASGDTIPASFFYGSQACQRCHADVFDQWESSAHKFSSFNNQWYRKSIEYMQDVIGEKPPKWCAGCHDPALLFSGRMEQPVEEFIDTEAAHAGLACVACHSITAIKSTRGNGGYVISYPKLHALVESENPALQKLHDFVLRVDPGVHRTAFMQPFHREQPAEFCQTCHKVHLDKPVNSYRWIRGFNTYDNWQASGVSGQGARSFYAPPNPLNCIDCHMPQVESEDEGHVDGFVSSHRFPAANTALPHANGDAVQMEHVYRFLQGGALTVDIFGLLDSRDEVRGEEVTATGQTGGDGDGAGRLATGFAMGEEAGGFVREPVRRDTLALQAPLDVVPPRISAGEVYRLDVVTRSRTIGHFFPSGTVDAQEAWVELEATDATGRRFFWSGFLEEDGDVDPSAHFFKSLMVDGNGNPIDKRNAWSMRSVVYVNLVPPGATDIAHYRVPIPADAVGPVTFVARLNYRKFTNFYTKFAYAGRAAHADTSASLVTADYDNRRFEFTGDVSTVSGPMKEIPDPPTVVIAADTIRVELDGALRSRTASGGGGNLWERWTDYGIGLLAEGDLRGAERAFARAAEADPNKGDSWVNLARVFVADDELERADSVLARADAVQPGFHKAHFFKAMVLKGYGRYDEAIAELDAVIRNYPRDRVVLNQRARLLFLDERLEEAVASFESVLAIDSEDLMAHYNLMLVHRALGNEVQAAEHETRYRRYKADETSQEVARDYRARDPHANNEAQAIHEHRSFYPSQK